MEGAALLRAEHVNVSGVPDPPSIEAWEMILLATCLIIEE